MNWRDDPLLVRLLGAVLSIGACASAGRAVRAERASQASSAPRAIDASTAPTRDASAPMSDAPIADAHVLSRAHVVTQWRVGVGRYVAVDPGNGHVISTTSTSVTLTPTSWVLESDNQARGQRARHERHDYGAPNDTTIAEVVALIAALPDSQQCWALSPVVPDEGSDDTLLTVFDGTADVPVCIHDGRGYAAAPPVISRLIALVQTPSGHTRR